MDNPNVFPDPMRGAEESASNQQPHEMGQGMTLLDYFAAKFMQGVVSDPYSDYTKYPKIAEISYDMAKHMLIERKKIMEEFDK